MICSVRNSKLMYSVDILPNQVQIKIQETVSGVLLTQLTCQSKGFQRTSCDASTHHRGPTWINAKRGGIA